MIAEVLVADWTAGEVAQLLGGTLRGSGTAPFTAATTDSRESREGVAFFALDGARQRGVEFVPAALGSGCSVVVVPQDWAGDVPSGRAAIVVPDPLAALGELARRVRADWTCPVIGITGSTGKTTVKEMTACVLAELGEVLRSPGNFNTMVGLSRTLLGPRDMPDLAVLECGASAPGEIRRLADLVRPTAAIVTNVAPAHLEGFGSIANVRREKCDLLRAVPEGGVRIVDGDDPELVAVARETGAVTRVGFRPDNDLAAEHLEIDGRGRASFRAGGVRVALTAPGRHQARNALFALALAEAHGVPAAAAAVRLATFTGVPGRLAIREHGGIVVADDSYNSNPSSIEAALEWLADQAAVGRKAAVLGDMLELGEDSEKLHAEVGGRVAGMDVDLALFVGSESRAAFEAGKGRLGDRCRHVPDADEAARFLRNWTRPGDTVLVKGSRGVGMERVVRALVPIAEGD